MLKLQTGLWFLLGWQAVMAQDGQANIAAVIDDFHLAASQADRVRYFGHLGEQAVFLGTDGSERWTRKSFEETYGAYMDSGKGWTFTSVERYITLGPGGTVAWFDEALRSEHYGSCRGSGVLVLRDGVWKIAQYNLSIPMPNHLAKEFVARIKREPEPPAKD